MMLFGAVIWPPLLTIVLSLLTAFAVTSFLGLLAPDPQLVQYLRMLAATGAFGGIVSGFIGNDRKLVLCAYPDDGTRHIRFGALADALIGISGAWGIFFVLGRSMRLGATTEDLLTLIGLGIVAGFSARALLATLRERLLRDAEAAAERAAEKKVESTVRIQTQASDTYSDLSDAALLIQISDITPAADAKTRLLHTAEAKLNEVTDREPNNPGAFNLLATIKKRLALLAGGADRNRLLDDAIKLCDRAIALKPDSDIGYYNRACYRALRGQPMEAILPDVDRAIELAPANKALFRQEPDLAAYRDDPQLVARLQ